MEHKKPFLIAAGYIAVALFTLCAVLIGGKSYTVYVNNPYNTRSVSVRSTEEGIVTDTEKAFKDGYVAVKFESIKPGKTQAYVTLYNEENIREHITAYSDFTVLPTGVIYITGYEYGGLRFTVLGMALLTVYTCALCLADFIHRKKTQFFSHRTMLALALTVFFGLQGIMYTTLYCMNVIMPQRMEGWRLFNFAGFIMSALFLLSIPLIVAFAGFLSFSNLSLIRREGFRKNNLFGILISLVLFVGSVLCVLSAVKNPNSVGIEMAQVRDAVIRTVVSSSFVYFECILFSAMLCTQYAARHEPKYNQDFIVILGCRVGKDGKPLPLLRGRIDRALDFYRKQLECGGRQAYFIPTGGKGSDEVISEAECMRNYLVENGIDESLIFPETEAATTLENMKFSKKIADSHKQNANILFSTTNYHVFRSGIYSAKAGMRADGIGAKTKWYFWPNAQMREFIGLLASEWKINILLIATITAVSTLFANIGTIVSWIVK